jgi:hypothetical protein
MTAAGSAADRTGRGVKRDGRREAMEEFDYDGNIDREPREDEEWGCIFPGKCCMPGEHRKGECHTAEMIEAFEAEMNRASAANEQEQRP